MIDPEYPVPFPLPPQPDDAPQPALLHTCTLTLGEDGWCPACDAEAEVAREAIAKLKAMAGKRPAPPAAPHGLTNDQEQHLASIKAQFIGLVDPKYRRGAASHGSDLFDLSPLELVEEAIHEAVDQLVYLLTLRAKLEQL